MALIRTGSLEDFSVKAHPTVIKRIPALKGLRTIATMSESTRETQTEPVDFEKSKERRGIGLQSIRLLKGFNGFLGKAFNRDNNIYFVSWAWDLSGAEPSLYPGQGRGAEDCVIKLGKGELRQFLGKGVVLFPARKVASGLALRIQLWESDKNLRRAGETLESVAKTIGASELNNVLKLLAMAGPTAATLGLVKDASLELAKAVGAVLKTNSDDFVDYYEGYFPVSTAWKDGKRLYSGHATTIALTQFS